MSKVVALNDRRPPVWYDVAVCHQWDGTVRTWIRAVDIEAADNRAKIALALRQAADGLDRPYSPEGHDLPAR